MSPFQSEYNLSKSSDVVFNSGASVVWHGPKKASHLNDDIGDTRMYNKDTGRYEIHFEDKII